MNVVHRAISRGALLVALAGSVPLLISEGKPQMCSVSSKDQIKPSQVKQWTGPQANQVQSSNSPGHAIRSKGLAGLKLECLDPCEERAETSYSKFVRKEIRR